MKPGQRDLLKKAEESLSAAKLMEQQDYHDFAAGKPRLERFS
jgi:hypothetical protein